MTKKGKKGKKGTGVSQKDLQMEKMLRVSKNEKQKKRALFK